MPNLHRSALLLASSLVLGACAAISPASSSAPGTSSPEPSLASATPAPSAHVFSSTLYGYSVTSNDWVGVATTTAWDGTGSPGDGDPMVDTLLGPSKRAFAYGKATTATLAEFADALLAAGAANHPCAVGVESTATTVGGAPARLDVCPPGDAVGSVFAISAVVVHAGRAYVFVAYTQPEGEAVLRAEFGLLLNAISFAA